MPSLQHCRFCFHLSVEFDRTEMSSWSFGSLKQIVVDICFLPPCLPRSKWPCQKKDQKECVDWRHWVPCFSFQNLCANGTCQMRIDALQYKGLLEAGILVFPIRCFRHFALKSGWDRKSDNNCFYALSTFYEQVIHAKSLTYRILFNLITICIPGVIISIKKPRLREVGYIF